MAKIKQIKQSLIYVGQTLRDSSKQILIYVEQTIRDSSIKTILSHALIDRTS